MPVREVAGCELRLGGVGGLEALQLRWYDHSRLSHLESTAVTTYGRGCGHPTPFAPVRPLTTMPCHLPPVNARPVNPGAANTACRASKPCAAQCTRAEPRRFLRPAGEARSQRACLASGVWRASRYRANPPAATARTNCCRTARH